MDTNNAARQMNQRWYCRINGQLKGPLEFPGLQALVANGELRGDDEVRTTRSQEWSRAADIDGLFPETAHADDLDAMLSSDDRPTPLPLRRDAARSSAVSVPFRQAAPLAAPVAPAVSTAYGETVEGRTWYCEMSGHEIGPLTFDAISELAQTGRLTHSDKVRNGLRAPWEIADSIVGLFPEPLAIAQEPPTEHRTPRPQPTPARERSVQQASVRPAAQKRRKAPSSAEVDALAEQLLAEDDEQPRSAPARRSGPATPPPPTREPVRAAEPPAPPPRPMTPAPTPAARTPNRPPPRRARKSEPMFSNLNISGKHIGIAAALLMIGAVSYFGLPSIGFGSGGPTSDLQQIWGDLLLLRDRDNLKLEDWTRFKDQTLPKVEELAKQFEAEGTGDEEAQKALRVCREYLPAIFKAGPAKMPPEWTKTEQTMAEFAS